MAKMYLVRFVSLFLIQCAAFAHAHDFGKRFIQPVPLQDVTLEANSRFDKAVSLNQEYLLGIDSDRLLKTFRINAGLDAPGQPLTGSWEDPNCELRGHYLGHWLSGTATLVKYTGDEELLNKSKHIIEELRKVQEKLDGGYLSAFPMEHFERLRNLQPVWAPFYVVHKIMAGLLDHYLFLGNGLALQMAIEEAIYFQKWQAGIVNKEGLDHWYQMLENEFGGMEEVLWNLFAATNYSSLEIGQFATSFTKPNWFDPLKANQDALPVRHANTHLAQVNGFAAGHEVLEGSQFTQESEERLQATKNFFDIVLAAHTYATGGNNNGEWWQAPHTLASTLAPDGAGRQTEETCTTYNMLKIARYLFRWTGDAKYADYYEKAILNGILGTQRIPDDYSSPKSNKLERPAHSSSLSSPIVQEYPQGKAYALESVIASVLKPVGTATRTLQTFHDSQNSSKPTNYSATNWREEAMRLFPGSALPEFDNSPGPGVIIYLLPLGAGNVKGDAGHGWSTPLNSFWCCSGATTEQFGKLMDSIYFQRVLQTVETDSRNNILVVRIQTEGSSEAGKAASAILKIRIPKWAASASFKIDYGTPLTALQTSELPYYWSVGVSPTVGSRIELKIKAAIRAEPIDDNNPAFANLQAVKLGPYVMAAITDGDREISLSPGDVANHVHDVDTRGLTTLRASNGLVLKQSGLNIALANESSCLSKMECTFRLARLQRLDGRLTMYSCDEGAVDSSCFLESMTLPGAFLSDDGKGGLNLRHARLGELADWALTVKSGPGDLIELHPADPAGRGLALGPDLPKGSVSLQSEPPLASYPEGARVLKGADKSYIIAPLGHIVEERYTPYLQFNPPTIIS